MGKSPDGGIPKWRYDELKDMSKGNHEQHIEDIVQKYNDKIEQAKNDEIDDFVDIDKYDYIVKHN